MKDNKDTEIKEIVDQYKILHKGDAQCKCISGARGHLIAKLESLLQQTREESYQQGVEETLKECGCICRFNNFGNLVMKSNCPVHAGEVKEFQKDLERFNE